MRGKNRRRGWATRLLLIWALCALVAPLGLEAAPPPEPSGAPSNPIDLNQANADELLAVPGIGPAMAQRIVEFRKQNGPFERVEDLMKVKGIGEKSFQKLKPFFKVVKQK